MVGPGGGPEHLTVLMAGESLFNDATSIVLFEVRRLMHSTLESNMPSEAPIRNEICLLQA